MNNVKNAQLDAFSAIFIGQIFKLKSNSYFKKSFFIVYKLIKSKDYVKSQAW